MNPTTRRPRVVVATLASMLLAIAAFMAPSAAHAKPSPTPPNVKVEQGTPEEAPVKPGTRDAKAEDPLGKTKLVKTDESGAVDKASASALAGNVSGVDFTTPYNYCWKQFVYTPVSNTTSATKYVQVRLYNQGMYRDLYTTINAGSTAYPGFYGVEGTWYAYLYVWNGSYYQYDEYLTNANNCNVKVERTYDSGGWVQVKLTNTGTAYATQVTSELAPTPSSGTYTGTKYHYPSPGGSSLYQWFYVGYYPYAIQSYTSGSWNNPVNFTGDH